MLLNDFLDTCRFSGQFPQVVDFVATDFAALNQFDASNIRGVDRERAFDADATRNFPNGERGVDASAATAHNDAFERLESLLVVLDDANVYPDGIAGTKVR